MTDRNLIEERFRFYIRKLRITPAWDVKLVWVEDPAWTKTGDFRIDCDDRKAVLLLNAVNPKQENLEEVVVHELMHLKLYPLDQVTESLVDSCFVEGTPAHAFASRQFFTTLEQTVEELAKCFLLEFGEDRTFSFGRCEARPSFNDLYDGLKSLGEPFSEGRGIGSRILVIGCPGSGKSTFAKRLHALSGIPLVHLDNVWWKPDRTHISREDFDCQLDALLAERSWIIDGNYSRTLERRIAACDTVVFLDYPEEVCMEGITGRVGKERTDIPWTEQTLDPELVDLVRNYRRENRPAVYALKERYPDRFWLVLESRKQAEEWLRAEEAVPSPSQETH